MFCERLISNPSIDRVAVWDRTYRAIRKIVVVGMLISFHDSSLVTLLILPRTEEAIDNNQHNHGAGSGEDCGKSVRVPGCVRGCKQEGSNNVAYTQ